MRYSSIIKRLAKHKKVKAVREKRIFFFGDNEEYEQWIKNNSSNDSDLIIIADYV